MTPIIINSLGVGEGSKTLAQSQASAYIVPGSLRWTEAKWLGDSCHGSPQLTVLYPQGP